MLQVQQQQQEEANSPEKSTGEVDLLLAEAFEVDKARVVKKLHELLAFLKSPAPIATRQSILDTIKGPLLGTILPSSLPRKRLIRDEEAPPSHAGDSDTTMFKQRRIGGKRKES